MTSPAETDRPPPPRPSGLSQPASLLELGNASSAEAERRRAEARADRERCKQAEEDVPFSSQHAFNVSIHWEAQRPEVRAKQAAAAGVVTNEMRKEWDAQDKMNMDTRESARFSILQVKRVQRWRKKVERWPSTFYMACPVQAKEDQGKDPGLGLEVLCRVSCARCSVFHHTQCCCRKGWSPRTTRVEERLEESYERKKIEEGEEKLRSEIAEDKARQATAAQRRDMACFRGPLVTTTPADGVGLTTGQEDMAATADEAHRSQLPQKNTMLKAQYADGEFYNAEVILARKVQPQVKVRILEGPGKGLEIYEAPTQLEWPVPSESAAESREKATGARGEVAPLISIAPFLGPVASAPPPPEPSRPPPHSPKWRQQQAEGAAGGHDAQQETYEEQARLLAAGPDYFGDVEDSSRSYGGRPFTPGVRQQPSQGSGRAGAWLTGNPNAARPPWEREDDFDETSYHEG